VAIADLHTGAPHITLEKVADVVARVNAARPDLVVLLGDYVIHGVLGGHFVEPERTAAALRGLAAPLGVVAVLGNHDWWYDGDRVSRALAAVPEAAPVIVLTHNPDVFVHVPARVLLTLAGTPTAAR